MGEYILPAFAVRMLILSLFALLVLLILFYREGLK
jgi:hypothetical protein